MSADEHEVTSHPIIKMDGGLIGFKWSCSCGRSTDGRHRTAEKAIERGHDHIRTPVTPREREPS